MLRLCGFGHQYMETPLNYVRATRSLRVPCHSQNIVHLLNANFRAESLQATGLLYVDIHGSVALAD